MVTIIENWAEIEGTVKSILGNPALSEYTIVNLELAASAEVESFPNLARADEGSTIRINVRTADLEHHGILPGQKLRCVVRKAAGQMYFIKQGG